MRRKPTATGFYPGNLEAQVDGFLRGWSIPEEGSQGAGQGEPEKFFHGRGRFWWRGRDQRSRLYEVSRCKTIPLQ